MSGSIAAVVIGERQEVGGLSLGIGAVEARE